MEPTYTRAELKRFREVAAQIVRVVGDCSMHGGDKLAAAVEAEAEKGHRRMGRNWGAGSDYLLPVEATANVMAARNAARALMERAEYLSAIRPGTRPDLARIDVRDAVTTSTRVLLATIAGAALADWIASVPDREDGYGRWTVAACDWSLMSTFDYSRMVSR